MPNNNTIKDVAKRAGVSIATVSRVVNGIDGVNKDTSEKVQKALNELNYKVNTIARSLKTNSTKLVGVLAPDFSNFFYDSLFQEFEKQLSVHGYSLIICSSDHNEVEEYKKMKMLLERSVDGIIFFSISDECSHLKKLNLEATIPMIMVDRTAEGIKVDKVISDNVYGTYYLTKSLIAEGFKRIGFMGGNKNVSNAKLRFKGYEKAMKEADLKIEKEFILCNGDLLQGGYDGMKKIFEHKNHPNAFVIENYMTHFGATSYFYTEVPPDKFKDITFASYDYMKNTSPLLNLCHYFMYQPLDQIGEQVVKLLLERIKNNSNDNPKTIIIKPQMKVTNGGTITNLDI